MSLADAQRARDILVGIGIPSHIADEQLWDQVLTGSDVIRVLVDNRSQERALLALTELRKANSARAQNHV